MQLLNSGVYTGSTPLSDIKENVIYQLLKNDNPILKKVPESILNRFYVIQSKRAQIQNSDCRVALKETLKLARHAFSGLGVLEWLC